MKNIKELLNKKIDAKDITKREESGRSLSYLEGHYVIAKLNEIFGNAEWQYSIKELTKVEETDTKTKTGKDVVKVGYLCQLNLEVRNSFGNYTKINDIGFGSGIDASRGKAHESATKEAVTDALKRCAKSLGDALGLCLYDKKFKPTQEKTLQERAEQFVKSLDEVMVQALVDFNNKDLAKQAGFKYNVDKKIWTKVCNKNDKFNFETRVLPS